MTEAETRTKLVELYQALSEHTEPECASACRLPRSCCDLGACADAESYALEHWGVELQRTGNRKLPFMGPGGCIFSIAAMTG